MDGGRHQELCDRAQLQIRLARLQRVPETVASRGTACLRGQPREAAFARRARRDGLKTRRSVFDAWARARVTTASGRARITTASDRRGCPGERDGGRGERGGERGAGRESGDRECRGRGHSTASDRKCCSGERGGGDRERRGERGAARESGGRASGGEHRAERETSALGGRTISTRSEEHQRAEERAPGERGGIRENGV